MSKNYVKVSLALNPGVDVPMDPALVSWVEPGTATRTASYCWTFDGTSAEETRAAFEASSALVRRLIERPLGAIRVSCWDPNAVLRHGQFSADRIGAFQTLLN